MAKIYELKISNFRGIKTFAAKINKGFVCLVGRGDTGKTTILNAISYVLSSSWNLSFYDSDFHNVDCNNSIVIEASLIDLPEKIISEDKYGLYIRGLDCDGIIQDELEDGHEKVLTIRLEVNKDLEPKWYVVNSRQEPSLISAPDRAIFNVFMISDYLDRHFSWSKGNPLYALLRARQASNEENNTIFIEAMRDAKGKIDEHDFNQLEGVTNEIKEISSDFGIDLSGIKTTIDFRDIAIQDGKISLHDGAVPFRLKGKGSKRLASMAIQTLLSQQGGIMLIDEAEQGLEPDRVTQLIRTLKKDNAGQIIITTHSSEVVAELEVEDLIIANNRRGELSASTPSEHFQDVIRACPEAGYAKKIIVCEGKTEIGICRALDIYRKNNGMEYMSFKDCVYTLGHGDNFTERAKKLKDLGKDVSVFCDSDKDDALAPNKEELRQHGIKIFDWDPGNHIEQQVFSDLPWDGLKEGVEYVIGNYSADAIKDSVNTRCAEDLDNNWLDVESEAKRKAVYDTANVKKWFKRVDHGEFLGGTIFKYFEQMADKTLKNQLESLSDWVDE